MILSKEEKIVVKLFRACNSVTFCRHECEVAEARVFAGTLGENVTRREYKGHKWDGAEKGKVTVAAFLKD